MILASEWSSLFDPETGIIRDADLFRKRLYHAGASEDIMTEVLPFAVGLYPLSSSLKERHQIDKEREEEFKRLVFQLDSRSQEQQDNDSEVVALLRVMTYDVDRTDRSHPFFRQSGGIGMRILKRLLQLYLFLNREIGYLQGMGDLIVPIVLTYIGKWNEDGIPLNPDGTENKDWEKLLPRMLWVFDAMLLNTGHTNFLRKIQQNSLLQTRTSFDLLMKVSPVAAIWMKHCQIDRFQWIYADYILMFKRSFEHIWTVWLQFNCSPNPKVWISYFLAAVLVDSICEITEFPEISMVRMMERIPKILSGIDLKRIAATSLWISRKVELRSESREAETCHLEFFQTDSVKTESAQTP